jgi:predicted membrane chloride channel (bestrophin family)
MLLLIISHAAALGYLSSVPQIARPPSVVQLPALPSLRHAPPRCGLWDEILAEAKLVRGSVLVEQPVLFDGDGEEAPFDIERWNRHRSPDRYGRLIPGILIGPTTRRISSTVAALVVFAALVGVYNDLARAGDMSSFLPPVQLPITPFELTSPVLGLLLVFRTDTANDRFTLGCDAVWEVTSSLRSLIRKRESPPSPCARLLSPSLVWMNQGPGSTRSLLARMRRRLAARFPTLGPQRVAHAHWHGVGSYLPLFTPPPPPPPPPSLSSSAVGVGCAVVAWTGREITSDAEREAALDLIDGSLLLHGWFMGSYLRGKALKGVQEAQLLRFASGRTEERAADVKVAMTPYLAITALSLGVSRRLPSLTDQEEVAIDEELGKLTDALGKCEKLLRAPIPLGYTRYSVRFLWLWLSLLPFALASTFAEFDAGTFWADKPQPVLAVAMLFVSFIFLSIEDIAVQIEEPFAILPLIKCHKWLLADVRRMRALVTSPTEPAAATDDGGAGDGA